jgi:hypothetical protein
LTRTFSNVLLLFYVWQGHSPMFYYYFTFDKDILQCSTIILRLTRTCYSPMFYYYFTFDKDMLFSNVLLLFYVWQGHSPMFYYYFTFDKDMLFSNVLLLFYNFKLLLNYFYYIVYYLFLCWIIITYMSHKFVFYLCN